MKSNYEPEEAEAHRYEELHVPEDYRRMLSQERSKPVVVEAVRGNRTKKTTCCGDTVKWAAIFIMGLALVASVATLLFFVLRSDADSDGQPYGGSKGGVASDTTDTPTAIVDCEDLYTQGQHTSGVYRISLNRVRQTDAFCEMELDGGGWTVFQRRFSGKVNFFRTWIEYKNGFGDVNGEHWLGNDNIHALTAGRGQKLKIEMTNTDRKVYHADYTEFSIEGEDHMYRLHVKGYDDSGITEGYLRPGDAMRYHDDFRFTTKDVENDRHGSANCAVADLGGWWYDACHRANLNGRYNGTAFEGITWFPITGNSGSLLTVRMMVKKF